MHGIKNQKLKKSLVVGVILLLIGLGIFPAVNPTIIGNETEVVTGENVLSQEQKLANVACCFYTLDGLEKITRRISVQNVQKLLVTSNKFSLSYMSAKDIGLCKIGNNFNLKKDYKADIPVIYISASSDYEYGLTTKGFFLRGSIARLKRAYELLNKYNGSIDVNFYKYIFTCDHGNGLRKNRPDSWDICRHALLYGTVCSIIIIPNRYGLYYCPGHPCRVGFRYLDFSKELGNISTA